LYFARFLSVHTEAPSNQEGIHRIQVIQRNQELFGRTLREFRNPLVLNAAL
jgi:hypothetical protein